MRPPPETLVEVVAARAAERGEAVFLRYLASGDASGPSVELSYAALFERASAIGAMLQQHGTTGDRVLLLFPSGPEFVAAFFGCLLAGRIAVPASPPDPKSPERALAKLRGIAADCGARIALTTSEHEPMLSAVAPAFPELAGLRCLASDVSDPAQGALWRRPEISPESVALVQYTSGSTGAPKGVVVRHRHLMANRRSIDAMMGPTGLVVGWLPVFHDMGLIGNVLQVLNVGTSLVLMSPIAFLKRPARWLEAISQHSAVTSGGPSFAYELCVHRVTEEERARLDLSSWEVAFCGAEPVREPTYSRFSRTFEPRGFRRAAFFPCYGLAEATLFVTGSQRGAPPKTCAVNTAALERGAVVLARDEDSDQRTLVSCGKPAPSEEVRIVDPDSARLVASNRVGEVWVRGPGVASGYWGSDAEALGDFAGTLDDGEGPFLRTGDLGFLHEGELYICGRRKDVFIVGGRNLFPQDIEATVEAAAPSVRAGCCAAFAVEHDGAERLVIVAESAASSPAIAPADVLRAIKRAVLEQHQATVHAVVLVEKGTIPKTSSGKLERYACRRAYTSGGLR